MSPWRPASPPAPGPGSRRSTPCCCASVTRRDGQPRRARSSRDWGATATGGSRASSIGGFSRALTALLVPTGISPNAVTLISIAIGLAAGGLFAVGNVRAGVAGALLFLASTIIDGCDGELARLTFRESRFGARLDVVGDNVVHVVVFGGIALGLYRRTHDPRAALAGWALVAGVLASMVVVYLSIVRREPSERQRALFGAFASREFAYLLVVLTLVGKLQWFLWLAALGTYAFVLGMIALRPRA